MGATSSKNLEWYPGHQTGNLYGDCSCGRARPPLGGPAKREKLERSITSLPIIELTDMKFVATGAYCSVFLCKYNGHSVAAKQVRQDLPLVAREAALDNLWTEFECLQSWSHPNVIDVYGLCRVKCREGYDDWNEKDVCLLVEELALGTVGHLFGTVYTVEKNLASAMAKSRLMKLVPFHCRLDRALELALALEYVHGGSQMGVTIHRDIKSVNVGFAKNGNLKLFDFGLAKTMPIAATESEETYQMTGEVGSYRYMAPEIVRHQPYNAKADIYSWAILAWEMLSIEKPYTGVTESTFIKRVVINGERPVLDKSWPDSLSKLLAFAWHPDSKTRPTASQLVVALRDIKAQLPAPRGSFKKRPSGTTQVSRRRHSWTGTVSVSSLHRSSSADQPRRGSTVQGTQSIVVLPGSGDDGTTARPATATEGANDVAAAAAAAAVGGEKPDSSTPASKPPRRFARLARSMSTVKNSSSSSSSSRRTSWYKPTKKSSPAPAPAPARLAKEDHSSDSEPRPTATAIPSPPMVVSGSILTTDGLGNDGGEDTPAVSGVVVAESTSGTERCDCYQGVFDKREAIISSLAFEAKEQTTSTTASPATNRFVAPPQKAHEAITPGRESATSDVTGDTSKPGSSSVADVGAPDTAEDISQRSIRRRTSMNKLWPSAPLHPTGKSDATPTSNDGGGESSGERISATNAVVGTVAVTVAE